MYKHFNHSPEDWNEDWDRKVIYLGTSSYSEKYALEFIIDKNRLRYTISDPYDMEKMSVELKSWNPQIKQWNNHYLEKNLYYRRENPIVNVGIGLYNRTTNEGFTGQSAITTQNFGSNLNIDGQYILNERWSVVGKIHLFRLDDLKYKNNATTYSFPYQYGVRIGMAYEKRPWLWYPFFDLELSSHANLRINPNFNTSSGSVDDFIENNFGRVLWLNGGLNFRGDLFDKGFYFNTSFGLTVLGDMEVGTQRVVSDFLGIKFQGIFKQYIYKRMYLELLGEYIRYSSNDSFSEYQVGLTLGATF